MEFKNYTRPFLKALVDNKDKILNILGREEIKISSDIYNEIVPVTFGIYGVESGMGNINPELLNIVLGILKLYNPDKYKTNPDIIRKYYSYSIIKDIEIDYNNEKKKFGLSGPNDSVGWTQIKWFWLPNIERQMDIVSQKDFMNPIKAAIATQCILCVRYNKYLKEESNKNVNKREVGNIINTWNQSPKYLERVLRYNQFITVTESDRPRVTEKGHYKKGQFFIELFNTLKHIFDINNNVNMNQQNIIINSYGKENMDYITPEFLTELLKKPFAAIQSYLKTLHFNEQHPENHNIKIPNKKEKYATVYNSGNWEFKNKKDVIENIVDNGYNVIDSHFDEVGENLEKIKKDRFSHFQEKFETDVKTKKTIEGEAEILILNGTPA